MEKVILTKEQAKAIERRKPLDANKRIAMIDHHINFGWEGERNVTLNHLNLDELIRALYIGYEVEPEFKVGDWVASKLSGEIRQITEIKSKEITPKRIVSDAIIDYPESLRHATPSEIAEEKERRWWAKNGRGVWELKVNDVLSFKESNTTYNVEQIGYLITISKGESSVNYRLDQVKKLFKVACFAENRLDV